MSAAGAGASNVTQALSGAGKLAAGGASKITSVLSGGFDVLKSGFAKQSSQGLDDDSGSRRVGERSGRGEGNMREGGVPAAASRRTGTSAQSRWQQQQQVDEDNDSGSGTEK